MHLSCSIPIHLWWQDEEGSLLEPELPNFNGPTGTLLASVSQPAQQASSSGGVPGNALGNTNGVMSFKLLIFVDSYSL